MLLSHMQYDFDSHADSSWYSESEQDGVGAIVGAAVERANVGSNEGSHVGASNAILHSSIVWMYCSQQDAPLSIAKYVTAVGAAVGE